MRKQKEVPEKRLWIITIAIVFLVAISAVQAVELVSLNEKVNSELSVLNSKKTSSLQKNLQNLPGMVGGC